MSSRKFLNERGNVIYVAHFPGTGFEEHEDLILQNESRNISIDKSITLITAATKNCTDTPLFRQAAKNGFKVLNDAVSISSWNNTKKIGCYLNSLAEADTQYALLLDARDTMITASLDADFIKTYKGFGMPVVYNGTPFAYPPVVIEPLQELLAVHGSARYLNAGVCFGTVESLIAFYTKAAELNSCIDSHGSEQLVIRRTKQVLPDIAAVDAEHKLFRIVHANDTEIETNEDGNYILK
jgi:hypothetical protein